MSDTTPPNRCLLWEEGTRGRRIVLGDTKGGHHLLNLYNGAVLQRGLPLRHWNHALEWVYTGQLPDLSAHTAKKHYLVRYKKNYVLLESVKKGANLTGRFTHFGKDYYFSEASIQSLERTLEDTPLLFSMGPKDSEYRLDVYLHDGFNKAPYLIGWAGPRDSVRPALVIRAQINQLPLLCALLHRFPKAPHPKLTTGLGQNLRSMFDDPNMLRCRLSDRGLAGFPWHMQIMRDYRNYIRNQYATHKPQEDLMSNYDYDDDTEDGTMMDQAKRFAHDAWEDSWDAGKTGLSAISVQKSVGTMGRKSLEKLIPDEYKGLLDTPAGDILIRLLSPQLLRLGTMVTPLPGKVQENLDGVSRRAFKGQFTYVTMHYGEALINALPPADEMVALARFAAAMASGEMSPQEEPGRNLPEHLPEDFVEKPVREKAFSNE